MSRELVIYFDDNKEDILLYKWIMTHKDTDKFIKNIIKDSMNYKSLNEYFTDRQNISKEPRKSLGITGEMSKFRR